MAPSTRSTALLVDNGRQINLDDDTIRLNFQVPVGDADPDTSHQQPAGVFAALPGNIKNAMQHEHVEGFNAALLRLDVAEVERLVPEMVEVGILTIVWAGNIMSSDDLQREEVKKHVLVTKARWCVCRGAEDEHDVMVECDESRCRRQWFHCRCVGLLDEEGNPDLSGEHWLCDECTGMTGRQWRKHSD